MACSKKGCKADAKGGKTSQAACKGGKTKPCK